MTNMNVLGNKSKKKTTLTDLSTQTQNSLYIAKYIKKMKKKEFSISTCLDRSIADKKTNNFNERGQILSRLERNVPYVSGQGHCSCSLFTTLTLASAGHIGHSAVLSKPTTPDYPLSTT